MCLVEIDLNMHVEVLRPIMLIVLHTRQSRCGWVKVCSIKGSAQKIGSCSLIESSCPLNRAKPYPQCHGAQQIVDELGLERLTVSDLQVRAYHQLIIMPRL